MYISAGLINNRQDVIVWERNENGDRITRTYPAPYYFYLHEKNGKYKDIYKNNLKRVDFDSYQEFKTSFDYYKNKGFKTFEGDIGPEYKILQEHYHKSKVPSVNITFFDIEVDYDREKGFSTIEDPYAPINAIAIHNYWENNSIVLFVPPSTTPNLSQSDLPDDITSEANVIICKNERQLLKLFFKLIENSDVISGWNSSFYDVPYVYERAKRLFGEAFANTLSFSGARPPKYRETFNKQGVPQMALDIFGRESVDYLELFKKFEVVERQSYSLESVSEDKLPELKKLEYEGSLYTLYREQPLDFIRYNIRDCVILKGLEDTLGYMQLAIHLAHDSCGLLSNVLGTIKLAELAIINYCHSEFDMKVPDVVFSESVGSNDKFTGALVLKPQVGMHDWVASVDVASLYPSAIRTVNISPDTIVGQFLEFNSAYTSIMLETNETLYFKLENGEIENRTAKEWKIFLKENSYSISGYGSVFSQKQQGFIPAILTDWFAQRKQYKKRVDTAKAKLKNLDKTSKEYKEQKQESEYCHRLQYIYKIRLNSLYGALGNRFFKFYDIRLAESTTRSGQEVLMHMIRKCAEILDGQYAYPSESMIYGDTDSSYFKTGATNKEDAVAVGKKVQNIVNESFAQFTRDSFLCIEGFDSLISAELDVVASKSIFIKKKYYVMQTTYAEGSDTDKIKLMGVQIKKTSIPKPISKQLTIFVQDLLKGKEWSILGEEIVKYKENLIENVKFTEIGLPKGIKKVEQYTENYEADNSTNLPGHIAAAIMYNICLDQYKDSESLKISSGMKIKTYYLKKKFGRFKSIAIPTDMKIIPNWFKTHFEDLIDKEAQVLRLVDKPLKSILSAIKKEVPTRKTLLFDELMEF